MPYNFSYFEPLHIHSLIFYAVLSIILIILPIYYRNMNKEKYSKYLGYFLLFLKVLDIFYRLVLEHESIKTVWPLNLCNIAIISAGIYFITKKNIFFNITYFYFSGAILAIILPGIDIYYTKGYVYMFMGTHFMEIFAVIYAFTHMEARVTKRGLKTAVLFYLFLTVFNRILNNILGTNYMYVNDYIISAVNFIKPINLYTFILTILFVTSMVLQYLPFMHTDNEIIEEKTIG